MFRVVVVLGYRQHLAISVAKPKWVEASVQMDGMDWVASIQRLKGVTITAFPAYFHTGPGVAAQSNFVLREMIETKRALGHPSVLLADFNCTPDAFVQGNAECHTAVKGALITPTNIEFNVQERCWR